MASEHTTDRTTSITNSRTTSITTNIKTITNPSTIRKASRRHVEKRSRFDKPFREYGGLLAFDLKHRRRKPSLADLQCDMNAMDEIEVEGNTIAPPLPAGVSDVIWNIWNRPRSLQTLHGQGDDHSWIGNELRKLLDAGIIKLVPDPDPASPDLGPIYDARPAVTFRTSELQVFVQRDRQNKPRGKVDGSVIYFADPTADGSHVLVWEVKPATKGDETVTASTARIADEQIRHRANSCHLNPTKSQVILLSVIGRHIRPYLWKVLPDPEVGADLGVIRPSNADVPVRISRVSSGPSPSLWRDLRSEEGKRLFQQVIVDLIRISQDLEVEYPEMYGLEGEGPNQAPIIDETTSSSGSQGLVSSPEFQPASSVSASHSAGSAGSAELSERSRSPGH